MNIFGFFKAKSQQEKLPEVETPAQIRTRRRHPRYKLHCEGGCFLEVADPTGACSRFDVRDLSFKGCLVAAQDLPWLDDSAKQAVLTFNLVRFGRRLPLYVQQLHKRAGGFALIFNHDSDEFVMALSQVLEPLKFGSTCQEIPQSISRESMTGNANRIRLSGDGPTDLVIEVNGEGDVTFAMATVRRGMTYASVIWEDGQLITKKSVDKNGVGARMSQTKEIDLDLIVYTGMVCLAVKHPSAHKLCKKLGRWVSSGD